MEAGSSPLVQTEGGKGVHPLHDKSNKYDLPFTSLVYVEIFLPLKCVSGASHEPGTIAGRDTES